MISEHFLFLRFVRFLDFKKEILSNEFNLAQ